MPKLVFFADFHVAKVHDVKAVGLVALAHDDLTRIRLGVSNARVVVLQELEGLATQLLIEAGEQIALLPVGVQRRLR